MAPKSASRRGPIAAATSTSSASRCSGAQDRDLLAYYRRLCAVRRAYPPLRRGSRRTLHVDAETLVYAKGEGAEGCIVALHMGEKEAKVHIDVEGLPAGYQDALSGARHVARQGALGLTLEPWQAAILVPELEDSHAR
ncbi:MAG: DUF3459 domain-containing protein [Anaerolineae bacterium]|nr:DUF3459 domain-containing protein [Anaerolineae bacterium]